MLAVVCDNQFWTLANAGRLARVIKAPGELTVRSIEGHNVLKILGTKSRMVFLTVPRSTAVMRLLETPRGEPSQIASAVALQLEANRILDDTHTTDYLPLPQRDDAAGPQYVLAVTVRKAVIDALVAPWLADGFRVAGVTVGALCLPCLRNNDNDKELIAVIAGDTQGADIAICRGHLPLASASVQCDWPDVGSTSRQIASAVSRLLAALPADLNGPLASAVFCFEERCSDYLPSLEAILRVPVKSWNPPVSLGPNRANSSAIPCDRSTAVAWALSTTLKKHSAIINFVAPRSSSAQPRSRWRSATRAALLLTIIMSILIAGYFNQKSRLAALLRTKNAIKEDLQAIIDRGSPKIAVVSKINDWRTSKVDWCEELLNFGQKMPQNSAVVIDRLNCTVHASTGEPLVRAIGVAKSHQDVLSWQDTLLADSRRNLQPHSITNNERDTEFPSSFEIEATSLRPERREPPQSP